MSQLSPPTSPVALQVCKLSELWSRDKCVANLARASHGQRVLTSTRTRPILCTRASRRFVWLCCKAGGGSLNATFGESAAEARNERQWKIRNQSVWVISFLSFLFQRFLVTCLLLAAWQGPKSACGEFIECKTTCVESCIRQVHSWESWSFYVCKHISFSDDESANQLKYKLSAIQWLWNPHRHCSWPYIHWCKVAPLTCEARYWGYHVHAMQCEMQDSIMYCNA